LEIISTIDYVLIMDVEDSIGDYKNRVMGRWRMRQQQQRRTLFVDTQ